MMEEAQQGRGVSDSLAVEHMLARSLLLAPIICSALTGWPENRSLAFRAARALDDEPNEETREDQSARAGSYEPEQKAVSREGRAGTRMVRMSAARHGSANSAPRPHRDGRTSHIQCHRLVI
jgi:hypothetical protein